MKVVKRTIWMWVIGLAFTMVWSGFAPARPWGDRAHQQGAEAQTISALASKSLPQYVPPKVSKPVGRRGGGTRSVDSGALSVLALAPEHVGLTADMQPSLYWYLSEATELPVAFTIGKARAVEPLFETRLVSPRASGIQRVQLADYKVRLAPGVEYHWYVSVIPDVTQRSRDVIASGVIQLQDAPEALQARLSEAGAHHRSHIYAEAGFWYDAISAVSGLIDAAPHNLELRRQRAALLEQVHLSEVAAYDRKTNGH